MRTAQERVLRFHFNSFGLRIFILNARPLEKRRTVMGYWIAAEVGVVVLAVAISVVIVLLWKRRSRHLNQKVLAHFRPTSAEKLTIASRKFPLRLRADLHRALDAFLEEGITVRWFSGVLGGGHMETCDFASLLQGSVEWTAPQYNDVNTGDGEPIRCLRSGVWLVSDRRDRYAVLSGPGVEFSSDGFKSFITLQVACRPGAAGEDFSKRLFAEVEKGVEQSSLYRGKIISLDANAEADGAGGDVTVHKLRQVQREDVILPQATLELLERNVVRFVEQRERLGRFGLARKKGVLFYGPPGTGKTHTIHYLAGALKGHTTLLISGENVGLLGEYMTIARLLQPSVVVIEDADLIARNRNDMQSACEEVMLNKLLNEMDGLKADADVIFILTTNRPEALEGALSGRPGRIDQAIEFPLPDGACRAKLVHLYSNRLRVPEEIVELIVRKTDGVSASFIKELMRRAAQFQLERDGVGDMNVEDVDGALQELLFSGGTLNRKLLGFHCHEIKC
jgi:cell division protease FtsH